MTIFICDGGEPFVERRIRFCPTERRRRRMVSRSQAWYGATWYCLGCGDRWSDGERWQRPFERGWKPKAIAYAQKLWDEAPVFKSQRERRVAFHIWLEAAL